MYVTSATSPRLVGSVACSMLAAWQHPQQSPPQMQQPLLPACPPIIHATNAPLSELQAYYAGPLLQAPARPAASCMQPAWLHVSADAHRYMWSPLSGAYITYMFLSVFRDASRTSTRMLHSIRLLRDGACRRGPSRWREHVESSCRRQLTASMGGLARFHLVVFGAQWPTSCDHRCSLKGGRVITCGSMQ